MDPGAPRTGKRGRKRRPLLLDTADQWIRIGFVLAYRGDPACALAFERLNLAYLCWAQVEPGVVYVMFRLRKSAKLREVLQAIVTWNELHTVDEQLVPFLLPGMTCIAEAQHGHQITHKLLGLQLEMAPNFQMKTYGDIVGIVEFERTPKPPTPLDRATKIDRENVVLREQIEYRKNRLEMYEPQEETRKHVPHMPLKASSILVLKSRDVMLPPGPDGVSPGSLKITRVTAPEPSDGHLVRPGPTLVKPGPVGISMEAGQIQPGSTQVFGMPTVQVGQRGLTWAPVEELAKIECDPSPKVSEEAQVMAEKACKSDCFTVIPVRPGAIGIKRGGDGAVKEPYVMAYCWGDKVLNAQLEAGVDFSLAN